MLLVPYVASPAKMWCALACYTMVAKYFFPDVALEDIAEISNWEAGYVCWAFPFWKWMVERGISIVDYDLADYEAFAEKGVDYWREAFPEAESDFFVNNTYDVAMIQESAKAILDHPYFSSVYQKTTMDMLVAHLTEWAVCEVVLNSRRLSARNGIVLHRVVVLDVSNDVVCFHDPSHEQWERRTIERSVFEQAWLHDIEWSELCVYKKI